MPLENVTTTYSKSYGMESFGIGNNNGQQTNTSFPGYLIEAEQVQHQ